MLYLAVSILLTIFLNLRLKKMLDNKLFAKNKEPEGLKKQYENLASQNKRLKAGNAGLEKFAGETIALYNITKDICKTLDEDKIFSIFKSNIDKYVNVLDCRFIKSEEGVIASGDETVLPLSINNKRIGYLSARGISNNEKDKFQILGQQFLLGIRRSLLYQKVQELTITDNLTKVFTRRHFLEKFNEELERSKRLNLKLAFLMIDIDHFKGFNDHYGHLVGDAIIREISKTIKENIRQIDFMGRYGGEELSVVLSETDKEQACFAAERIRKAIEAGEISLYDESLKATVSIGISTFPLDSREAKELIDKADQALYLAKGSGRNKACAYGALGK